MNKYQIPNHNNKEVWHFKCYITNKISKIFIFLFFLLCFVGVSAQGFDEFYINNSLNVYGKDSSDSYFRIVKNLDENDNRIWISASLDTYNSISPRFTLNYDPQTGIIDSLIALNFHYKFNNKLYFVDNKFISLDLDNQDIGLTERLIYNFPQDGFSPNVHSQNIFTKEREFYVFYYSEQINKTLIYVVDTLGNTLRADTIDKFIESCDLIDHGNSIVLSNNLSLSQMDYYLYFIDKLSLQITDSIGIEDLVNGGDIISLNDSILIFENYKKIEKINTNTKVSTIIIPNMFNPPIGLNNFILGIRERRIDYVNPDSIYLCSVKQHLNDSNEYIHIINFSSSGVLHYNYTISFDANNYLRTIGGTQSTNEGKFMFAVNSRRPYGFKNYIVIFNSDGLSIEDITTKEKESIKVYPNPAKDYVYVDIEATNFEKGEIELFDMQGKLVKKAKLSAKQGNRVDVSNLNAGAYTYNVSLNGKTISGKVIVGK